MKILIPLSLLVLGIAIGYAVGINLGEIEKENQLVTDSIPSVQSVIHDTIVETKIVKIETEELVIPEIDSLTLDTLNQILLELDSLIEEPIGIEEDSIVDENLNILSDVRLKLIKLPLKHLTEKIIDSDSLLKSAIDINDIDNKYINVEFWESPVNFSGYKLSKSKLIIYGLSPQLEYQLFKKGKSYYLMVHSITYELFETAYFKQFTQISNPIK